MKGVNINGTYYKQVYGGTIPAAIWRTAMSAALTGVPVQDLSPADPTVAGGSKLTVPDVTGQPYDVAKQTLLDAGFGVRSGGFVAAAPTPFGIVPYTYPHAGTPVTVGTSITVYVSNGSAAPPPPSPAPATSPSPAQQPPAPQPKPTKKRGHA